jgi:hypothetical protein
MLPRDLIKRPGTFEIDHFDFEGNFDTRDTLERSDRAASVARAHGVHSMPFRGDGRTFRRVVRVPRRVSAASDVYHGAGRPRCVRVGPQPSPNPPRLVASAGHPERQSGNCSEASISGNTLEDIYTYIQIHIHMYYTCAPTGVVHAGGHDVQIPFSFAELPRGHTTPCTQLLDP